ncbi:hypothetical protein H8356DRAFT_1329772 [Neocallimastix lanati (nom. inval.)]|nr:hypothetical protein H8356DRAFT_1329772 [Neocallimastix sp. JGI-2020a]
MLKKIKALGTFHYPNNYWDSSVKNKKFSKFQIRLDLGPKNEKFFYGYYLIKFSNGSEDPLNLRQIIYNNMIQILY